MEKRATIISLIFVGIVVISAVALIIFSGITAREYNYVQLEINPRVEFIVDKKFKVVSYSPLNEDGLVILAGENFKGMDIASACKKYIDLCARTGYIEIDGVDNAVNLTIIDGITQALDVHIIESINEYLRETEIMCAVVENYEDRNMYDKKKKDNICCSNKYKLISTIIEKDPSQDMDKLKRLSEIELIDIVANNHSTEHYLVSEEIMQKKKELLNNHREIYSSHMLKITNNSKKEFSSLIDKLQKTTAEKDKQNFTKEYNNWQNNIT